MANESGYQFYKNDPEWLPFTPRGGGHSGIIRIRFNSIAQTVLDSEGKLPIGAEFPEGSVVVKEIKSRIEQVAGDQGHRDFVRTFGLRP